ncbi:hypothetical protein [uncultured Arthrobacter sp.]|uniref:hypothetical protein n=1 Tax=uncultured Arthrobacter sp. TaxID=114050 RepID=UPI0026264AD5|nr:hypothetical protein [uncultured Arthrobacter sp.]
MSVEIIGALAIMAAAALMVLVASFAAPRRRSSDHVAPVARAVTVISEADQRLLPYLQLTAAQWRSFTDLQRTELRKRAQRSMN